MRLNAVLGSHDESDCEILDKGGLLGVPHNKFMMDGCRQMNGGVRPTWSIRTIPILKLSESSSNECTPQLFCNKLRGNSPGF